MICFKKWVPSKALQLQHTSFHPPKMLRFKLDKNLDFPLQIVHRNIPSFEKSADFVAQTLSFKVWRSSRIMDNMSCEDPISKGKGNLLRTVWEGKVIISVEKGTSSKLLLTNPFVGIAFPLTTAEIRQYDSLVLQFWQSSRSCWLKCWISTISCWAFWYLSDLCIFIPGIKQFFVLL